jgi:hypothetical protein
VYQVFQNNQILTLNYYFQLNYRFLMQIQVESLQIIFIVGEEHNEGEQSFSARQG